MKAWYEHTRRTVAPAALALAATAAGLLVTAQQAVAQGPNNHPPYIDVGNNMIIDSNLGDLNAALAMVQSGYDGGYWDGPGINSIGAAALDPWAPNGEIGVTVLDTSWWPGIASVFGYALDGNGDQLVIAAGLIGDLNMDGVVDSTDYGMLDIDYTYGLLEGDITHQGFVDSSSYAAMDTCYTYQGLYDPTTLKQYSVTSSASASATGASGSPSSVPEPATGSLLITGAIAALNYRRKIKTA